MVDNITRIINRIQNTLNNEDKNQLGVVGKQIVGIVGGMEGVEIMYAHYPLLEVIANRSTELSLTSDENRAKQLVVEIQKYVDELKGNVHV